MKYSIYILLSLLLLLPAGCNHSETLPQEESGGADGSEQQLITLRGDGIEAVTLPRALDNFPNNRKIGVIAAEYQTGTIDWTSYPDIDNAGATATSEVGDTYFFSWDSPKYWPFDGSQLVFIAYSPVANGSSVTLSSDRTELSLQLVQEMPDVMCASNNSSPVPLSKTDTIVDLGEFRHALSQLTVEVVPDTVSNPAIRITSLLVESGHTNATLDLFDGDSGPTLTDNTLFTYQVINIATAFNPTPFSKTVLLYPGTEASTRVYIRLMDGPFPVEGWYPLPDIPNLTTGGTGLTLEQGVNTTLTFTVKSTSVQNPNENIDLEGQLTDWKEMGEYQIIVQ
ncbi:MAG: fimbrillin family protein [Bacteroides sp.]|nr:fimbrillin family protein [Bacteroides sp.]